MIDTIDVFCNLKSYDDYNALYKSIDQLSRSVNGQALHREKKERKYITTAFAEKGVLQIALQRTKYTNLCRMYLKPVLAISPFSHFILSREEHFSPACSRLNDLIVMINTSAGQNILPPVEDWHVMRIDYAFDIETPLVLKYISLFKAGDIPAGFSDPEEFESSVYMRSAGSNINFYDKIAQVKATYGLTDDEINAELQRPTPGILRLEVQCHLPTILHLKKKNTIPNTKFSSLFSMEIAQKIVKKRVKDIIGTEDFYFLNRLIDTVGEKYGLKMMHKTIKIAHLLIQGANLSKIRDAYTTKKKKNTLAQILHKIRKLGINPIPIDVAFGIHIKGIESSSIIENPYALIAVQPS